MHSIPLNLICYWKCEQTQTDFRLDYRFNRSHRAPLSSVSVLVPVDGEVTHMQSKPTATWYVNYILITSYSGVTNM